ncbi:MAG: glycosyltransferase family 39 protein [Gallionellaceae bacterium]|nr:glycosyltransferase family 39 protein [Gallionellaceae bacterium]
MEPGLPGLSIARHYSTKATAGRWRYNRALLRATSHEEDTLESTGPTPSGEGKRFLYSLPGVLAVVAAYALVHTGARLLASGNLGEDDPYDNLLIQVLAPGYGVRQGPLYDWALWALQQVLGTGVQAFLLLKYGLLVGMAGWLFLITRRITGSALWGFMAVDAMALVYQIFWRFHEGFTHRVGAMALAVATVWALLLLVDRGRRRDYALFAILAGLGLLTEHTYAVFLVALLAAAWLQPAIRRQVYAAPLLAMLPIPLLIVAPYAAWLLADPQRGADFVSGLVSVTARHTPKDVLHALRDALSFPVLVLSPYIFILPTVFPGVLKTLFRQTAIRPAQGVAPDFGQLILHLLLIEVAWLVLFDTLLLPRSDYAVHSLLPMFVIGLAWLTEKARQSRPSPARIKVFVAIMLTLTVVAFLGRAANMFVHEPVCSKCRWGVPYADLARTLRERGFQSGSIVVDNVELGGNLRRFFPDARFVVAGLDLTGTGNAGGQTAIVWPATADGEAPPDLRAYLGSARPEPVQAPWRHLWKPTGYRTSDWQLAILNPH